MPVRGLEYLRVGRSKEEDFKRSFELWERTAAWDVSRKAAPDPLPEQGMAGSQSL